MPIPPQVPASPPPRPASPPAARPVAAAPDADEAKRRLAASRDVFQLSPEGAAGFRRVERDVVDAFLPRASDVLARVAPRAARQVEANAAAEAAALARLGAPARAKYERVAKLVAPLPLARLSLQLLLLDGQLPGDRPATGGDRLLDALERLERDPLLPALDRDGAGARLDRAYLMGGLLHEIAFPSAINQHAKKTCTVTTAQILLARHHPAEYVRIVAALASPQGVAHLANGERAERVPGTESWGTVPRTVSGRLWQAAMMDFGNGAARYDDAADLSDPAGAPYSGLTNQQFGRVVSALTGMESRPWWAANGTTAAEVLAKVEASLAAGLPVPTSVRWGVRGADGTSDAYHKVLVVGVEGDRVRYMNPWGTEESMSRASFLDRVEGINPLHPDWAWPRPQATSYAPRPRQ